MTRRLVLALAVLCGLAGSSVAQPGQTGRPELPPEILKMYQEKPVIELVTMGVGGLMWERHGHIALCVRYDNPREDACYNYGIGDFRHPLKMTWGFFRGANSFWVGKMNPREMLSIYQYADRTIWVQPLPLTSEQEKQVIEKLEFDILEPNKHYSYDHFWDNCTTRVRDILDDATKGALSSMTNETDDRTYRDLAREGFFGMRVPLLITDLSMGRVTDRVPSYWERMFLPDYLREAVIAKWGIKPIPIYERKGPPPLKDGPSGRLILSLILLVLTAPVWATRLWGRFQRTGLWFAVMPIVFIGIVYWGLALISPLPYVRWNETLLCLMPFDLLLVLLKGENQKKYARGRVIMLALVAALLLIDVLKAPIWPALLWALVPNAVVAFLAVKPITVKAEADTEGAADDKKKNAKKSKAA